MHSYKLTYHKPACCILFKHAFTECDPIFVFRFTPDPLIVCNPEITECTFLTLQYVFPNTVAARRGEAGAASDSEAVENL